MVDLTTATHIELEMLVCAYEKLRIKNPDHELLRMATLHPDKKIFTLTSDYKRLFVEEEDQFDIQGYMRYRFALENALVNTQAD